MLHSHPSCRSGISLALAQQGDIITILEKDRSGWWKGELNGTVGYFPSVEWVEEIPMQAAAAAAPMMMQQQPQPQPVAAAPYAAPAARRCRVRMRLVNGRCSLSCGDSL